MARTFGWTSIVRLGFVQAALGAIVVLTTSTLNRVMVVELALPALLPGLLVGIHYAMQSLRPRMGFGSDVGGRRTPWIVGGMAVLAVGGVGAAAATALMASQLALGSAAAVVSFMVIGAGVSACGTSLLVLLAKRVDAPRRAAACRAVPCRAASPCCATQRRVAPCRAALRRAVPRSTVPCRAVASPAEVAEVVAEVAAVAAEVAEVATTSRKSQRTSHRKSRKSQKSERKSQRRSHR